jgi:hypothetical protein
VVGSIRYNVRMLKNLRRSILTSLACISLAAQAQETTPAAPATGTLQLEIAAFTSEVTLKPKIQTQLASGGIEWGQKGDRIVFTYVNKRFLNFDIPYLTRFGETRKLELPEGDYAVTCVGFLPATAFSVEKALSKGAYFNRNVMTVHVAVGKTTTLTMKPVIRKQATFFLTFFMPEMLTSSTLDGVTSPEISLNEKSTASVKWDDYVGDLKFQPGSKP